DPPDLALEVAQAGADLDAEFLQEALADGQVFDAVRNAHGVQLRQLLPLGRDVLQAQRQQPGLERQVILLVPLPASVEPLLEDEAQSLTKGVDHRDRRRVVVDAILAPVLLDDARVEVPALYLRLAAANGVEGTLAERHRRQSRRTAQPLLRATVDR